MSARRSQTRNGGTMPAACFDVRPSPSPAVPCREYSKATPSRKASSVCHFQIGNCHRSTCDISSTVNGWLDPCEQASTTLSPRAVFEAHAQTQNACFDVPNIPGSGAAPRVLPPAPLPAPSQTAMVDQAKIRRGQLTQISDQSASGLLKKRAGQ